MNDCHGEMIDKKKRESNDRFFFLNEKDEANKRFQILNPRRALRYASNIQLRHNSYEHKTLSS